MQPVNQGERAFVPSIEAGLEGKDQADEGRVSTMDAIKLLVLELQGTIKAQAEQISALEAKVVQLKSDADIERAAWQSLFVSLQKTMREEMSRHLETISTLSNQNALLSQHVGTLTTKFEKHKHLANGLPNTTVVKTKK